jgi:hypothetical protein
MTQPFVALITPLPSTPGVPTHPIAQPPLGTWGGVAPPYVDIGGPGPQPKPPGYWGGVAPPYVDIGGPAPQPHPEHPIVLPPPPGTGPGAPPIAVQLPVFPWTPQHPIALPPEMVPPPVEGSPPIEWKAAWLPSTGWIIVGVPSGAHPTPSA